MSGQDELVLLDRVLLRLATADTDEALTSAVNKYLPSCLLKLSSQQDGVRKKVMELLVHINKRIKENHNIQLPMDALLLQYQDPSATSFVTNFTIIYIKLGFPRLPSDRQAELVPTVLSSIDGKPVSHQDSLIFMILPVLDQLENQKKGFSALEEKPQVCRLLSQFLLDFLLLPYGSHPSLKAAPENPEDEIPSSKLHPGLSEVSWKRVAGETPFKAEDLEKLKVKIVKFLGFGLLGEIDIAIHIVVAMADTRHSVASEAENIMRKFSAFFDWDDTGLVSKLYALFLGTLVLKDKPAPKPEHRRAPANTRIRLKLMPYLLKSREAAVQFPASIQVTFDLLFGTTGNSNGKLKMQAVSFIHHIIYHCPSQRLATIGAVLLSALTRLVNEEKDNPKLRASCYVAIGKLGLKVPQLVNKDVTMIQTFFEAISTEDKETQLSVQEAMSLMAPSFKQMEAKSLTFMEAMLATYIEKDESQVRLVAAQYAGEVFQSNHVASRYILLLGAGDIKEEISKVAKGHLYGAINKIRQANDSRYHADVPKVEDTKDCLPAFVAMVKYVLEKANIRVKTQQKHVIGDKVLAFNPFVYENILDYLRTCLLHSSGMIPALESAEEPQYGAPKVTKYLSELSQNEEVKKQNLIIKFIEFAERFLAARPGLSQANALLQLVGCTFQTTADRFVGKVSWLKGLLDNTREDIRETVAQLFALVVGQLDEKDFEQAMTELTKHFKEKNLEFQHGIIVALGFGFGRKMMLLTSKKKESNFNDWGSYKTCLDLILAQLQNSHALMIGSSCTAIAELGRCGSLPLLDQGSEEKNTKLSVVNKLLSLVKSGKTPMKVREKAALALGQLCIGDQKFPHRRLVLQEFLNSAQDIKDLELHFTMGEGMVYAAIGPLSPKGRDFWTVEEDEFEATVDSTSSDEHLEWLINELCNKHTQSTHPNVKQASCLWLLALVKYGKDFEKVKSKLLEVQSAFMSLLGDNNDIVQDAASKGLGLVYDSSSEEQRGKMVSILLNTLTDGQRQVQKVSGDTKLFDESQMGKTPTGGNLSTYKEICSLATDLNQPDLVYKFMHLANYNAMWNSKKGAAFGFSSIATKAGEQISQHLPKIVPKLYRYKFDPTPKIQESMSSIWSALIPETNKTVDKYLTEILTEIEMNLVSNQWKVRESCCNALQDLLRGRSFQGESLTRLSNIWINLFRVMDDIKESVRVAAGKAADSLSRTCIKMCDMGQQGSKSGEAAVQAILPPLLEHGLQSQVPDVRSIVIATIMKVTKSGGALLKPHLALLIPALLESASEMESKEISYISVKMANDPSIQEKIDMARITAAKSSPMMECVNFVLQYVDAETLQKLVPRLIDLIKGNVGLGAKGTTAHLITTLTHECPMDLQPYTGKILAAFVNGLADRNPAVRKTYAAAIGHLMKTAKDSSMEKLFVKLRTWYLEKTDEASKWAVAYTFQAVNRHNPDRLKAHSLQVMPLVFLGMHEEKVAGINDEIIDIWDEVWSDGTPGTEGGIRMHLKEIMSLLNVAVESQQWKMKAQAARAMGKIGEKLGENIQTNDQKVLLITLLNSLAGRTWDGKEAVVVALGDVCVNGPKGIEQILNQGEVTRDKLIECLMRECKKEKKGYKIVALETTGRIVEALDFDLFEDIFELLFPLIKAEEENEADGDKEEQDKEESEKVLEIRHAIFECLGACWPKSIESQVKHQEALQKLLSTLNSRIQMTTRKNQLCIAKCVSKIICQWENKVPFGENSSEITLTLAKIISFALSMPKSTQLRLEGLSILGKILSLLDQEDPISGEVYTEVSKSLDDLIKDVSADAATKAKARELKPILVKFKKEEEEEMEQNE